MYNFLITVVFCLAYLFIALEHKIRVNKAAVALVAGTLTWTILILSSGGSSEVAALITRQMGNISGILFFLLGAMTIVELVDSHHGFDIITDRIGLKGNRALLLIISLITFFLSAILDNLTTTIIMVSLCRKLLRSEKERWLYAGMIVIAANAGGAWSPIGDVTTTMLWIGQQISAGRIVARLFLPALTCVMIPFAGMLFILPAEHGQQARKEIAQGDGGIPSLQKNMVFFAGMTSLLLVPFFKAITGLPPFMGMIFFLGLMWLLTELIDRGRKEPRRDALSVVSALRRLDTPTILFFLGILLCISALEASGMLSAFSGYLSSRIHSQSFLVICIGLVSSVIDNVPLVAAVQGMYSLGLYPTDSFFWEFLAYAAGTGGSILVIGSAAGVAAMGLERITFTWYMKKIGPLALAGYLGGAGIYILERMIFAF